MEFSIWELLKEATLVVKIVMALLVLASVWSWGVVIGKSFSFARARRETRIFETAFWSGEPLDEIYERLGTTPRGAAEKVFVAGMREWRRSHDRDGKLIGGAQARIDRAMGVAITREADQMLNGLTVLATIGAISPFVGLFGTVWGILIAFTQIGSQESANLAVVAPAIAEALFATALGLVAAIPAVIFYNKLSGDADRIAATHENFADEFSMILSRQLERG